MIWNLMFMYLSSVNIPTLVYSLLNFNFSLTLFTLTLHVSAPSGHLQVSWYVTTAAPSDLHLPRLSLELEVLISGYWCFTDGRETHLGVNESGSPEHTLYWSLNLQFKTGSNLYIILRASSSVHPTRYLCCKTLLCSLSTFKHLSSSAPSKQLPLSLQVTPLGTKQYKKITSETKGRTRHLFYVYLHIFRDAHKPLSVFKTLEQGIQDPYWPVSHLVSLWVYDTRSKQVALVTMRHPKPMDNGWITTIRFRDGISSEERLSWRDTA
jgi:hypothetical protein